jgi:hypothetical protein
MRPFLQSAGLGNKGQVYRKNNGLTRPFLQSHSCWIAKQIVVWYCGPVAIDDCVPGIGDAAGGNFSNSLGFVFASFPSNLFGWPYNPDLFVSFAFARGPSLPAGTPDGYNTAGPLPGDSEEKNLDNAGIVSGSWLPSWETINRPHIL